LLPPSYLDCSGKPHTGGISLDEPPLCCRCVDLRDAAPKLEQHAAVMNLSNAYGVTSQPVGWTTSRVSTFRPLQMESQAVCEDLPTPLEIARQKPGWMSLLPSNRNPYIHPPPNSALQRRASFPYFSTTRFPSSFATPAEWPVTGDLSGHPLAPACFALPMGLSTWCLGEWPSPSQSFTWSGSGREVIIEGAVVTDDLASNKPSSGLAEPELSTRDIVSNEKTSDFTTPTDQNQTGSLSPISLLAGSNILTPTKSRQSRLGDHHSPWPAKLGKKPMAESVPEVPDAARHRPAYFKELSGFIARQVEKPILPSRVLNRRQNLDRILKPKPAGNKLSPTLIVDADNTSNRGAMVDEGIANKSNEKLDLLSAKMVGLISAGSHDRAPGLCRACRECPCRTSPTKGQRRRLVKASR
jgi:hypothetical protein